jgi:ABC-2 type transport system permease protein
MNLNLPFNALRRKAQIYAPFAALAPKMFMAYQSWFWAGLVLNVIGLAMYVFFWRAVYAGQAQIAGLSLQQTLNYILLGQILWPIADLFILYEFGYNLREGGIANALLRPVDLQGSYYVTTLAQFAMMLIYQLPMAVVATLFFGLTWPLAPSRWLAFIIATLLGRTIMFLFDWLMASFTFYTTETWGLSVILFGLINFLSGALIPLQMMPDGLRAFVYAFPFAQVVYVPISLLSGITPLADAPRLWLGQIAWIIGLWIAGRLFFRRALRKVTVQGG